MFTIDYSQAKEFGAIADGTYEVTIDLAKQDATQGGADYLDIRFRIRNQGLPDGRRPAPGSDPRAAGWRRAG